MTQNSFDGVPDFNDVLHKSADGTWFLLEEDYEPALEHEFESRFTVSNGFLGIRGSLEIPSQASSPRTYVAGLFDTRPGPPPFSSLIPAPLAFPLRLLVDGEALQIDSGKVLQHSRLLDYKNGCLRSAWKQALPSGRVVYLESLRFVPLFVPNLAVQLLRLTCAPAATLTVIADEPAMMSGDRAGPLQTRTGSMRLACIRELRTQRDRRPVSPWQKSPPSELRVDKGRHLSVLALTSYGLEESPDLAVEQAQGALHLGKRLGLRRLYEGHARRWQERWHASDVLVTGDDEAQNALRFALFHLIGADDPRDPRTSVAARGLTGDGYLGHVFWDTEIFMLPFYIFTWPEAARSMLEYRFRTLAAARAKASRLGYRGALYAWESTDTGDEMTPAWVLGPRGEVIAIRNGEMEQHVSAAVAFGVWQYWLATHDADFLRKAGAEILLETARFWVSRAQREADERFHIRHVIGPDEYHEDVDDNAYTNYMARWNIERGLDVAELLRRRWPARWRELAGELVLTDEELDAWRAIAKALYLPLDVATGLIEQFSGYFGLEQVEVPPFADRAAPMDVLLGPQRTRRSQVIKQADVLMLMTLIPDEFGPTAQGRNFNYYEPRCGHGSSLSPPIHSLIAARVGRVDLAEAYFHQTADIDLSNSMGNSAAGLHMAALGGLWQAAVFGFGGLSLHRDSLELNPRLPASWRRLRFPVRWRQRQLVVDISQERRSISVTQATGRPATIQIGGDRHRLERGRTLELPLSTWKENTDDRAR